MTLGTGGEIGVEYGGDDAYEGSTAFRDSGVTAVDAHEAVLGEILQCADLGDK